MESLQSKLNQTNNDIIQMIVSGKGECYSNLDRIVLKPGSIEKLNQLIARRNTLIELMKELRGEHAGNQAQEEKTLHAYTPGLVEQSNSR